MTSSSLTRRSLLAWLRDERVLQALGQIVFVVIIVTLLSQLLTAIFTSLAAKNLTPTFAFLQNRSGFDISNAPSWYSSNNTYWDAFQVGVSNTLRIVTVGLVLTTILGVLVGIFLLSTNWLIRTISRVYVEVLRNTPLLVQLFVWYFIIMLSLPPFQQPLTLPSEGVMLVPARLLLAIAIYVVVMWSQRRRGSHTPRRLMIQAALLAAFATIEIAFALSAARPDWAGIYGKGNPFFPPFLAYLVISILLILAGWFAPGVIRWRLLGVTSGQLIGGLLYYFGAAPTAALRIEMTPAIYISVRGFVFPETLITSRFAEWAAFIGIGLALALVMWVYFGRLTETTGRQIPRGWYALLAILVFAVLGWVFIGMEPAPPTVTVRQDDQVVVLPLEEARAAGLLTTADEQLVSRQPLLFFLPEKTNFRFTRGTEIPPEYMGLLLGLVVYTSAFIAEIVRAGILAVPRGQIEASRALGLTTSQTLRLVVLPQALRVIIPPLANQYLNLSKNSSLAIAVAYADVVLVSTTIMNQSGQSVTGITMLMAVYLIISLTISFFTNWFNRRFQLVTR